MEDGVGGEGGSVGAGKLFAEDGERDVLDAGVCSGRRADLRGWSLVERGGTMRREERRRRKEEEGNAERGS